MLPIMPVGKFVGPKFIYTVLIFLKLHYLIPKPCIFSSLPLLASRSSINCPWTAHVAISRGKARSPGPTATCTSLGVSVVNAK